MQMIRRSTALTILVSLMLMVAMLVLAAGCERRPRRSRAQYARRSDVVALNEMMKQAQSRLASLEKKQGAGDQRDAQSVQRVAALEQQVKVLQQSQANLTQENMALRQQLTKTQMELAATQEEVQRMKAQAGAARRVVRDWQRGRR